MFSYQVGIIQPERGPLGDIFQEGDPFFAHLSFPLDVGNDIHLFYRFQRSLGICIKDPDGVHFVVKEIDAARVTGSIGEDISNTAPDGVLSGFMYKIDQLKLIGLQHLFQEGHIDFLSLSDLQGGLCQLLSGDHRFNQCLGIAYYKTGHPPFRKPAEGLGPGDDIGFVGLLVLHRPLVRGRKKKGPVGRSIHCHQVGIEVSGLLFVLKYN